MIYFLLFLTLALILIRDITCEYQLEVFNYTTPQNPHQFRKIWGDKEGYLYLIDNANFTLQIIHPLYKTNIKSIVLPEPVQYTV
ncbi:MAG: hypothetical protein K2P99_06020, partial [Burkholderiales bacterium]|nr:hypothetical protein [Burkholderiales bacterium]